MLGAVRVAVLVDADRAVGVLRQDLLLPVLKIAGLLSGSVRVCQTAVGFPGKYGMDAVLFLIGAATGIDYTKEGRTAEKMGLKGKTVEEMYAMVR